MTRDWGLWPNYDQPYFKAVLVMRNYAEHNVITFHRIYIILFYQKQIELHSAHLTSQGHICPRHRHGVLWPLQEVGRLWKQKTGLTRQTSSVNIKTFVFYRNWLILGNWVRSGRGGRDKHHLFCCTFPILQVCKFLCKQSATSHNTHPSVGEGRGQKLVKLWQTQLHSNKQHFKVMLGQKLSLVNIGSPATGNFALANYFDAY